MDLIKTVKFIDHKAALSKPDTYIEVQVEVAPVLESWRDSMFSFEWLDGEGQVRPVGELKDKDQERYWFVEDALRKTKELEKPILGIGLQDNVEIGSGKAVFLVLAAKGMKSIPVHIPKSNESDFKAFVSTL